MAPRRTAAVSSVDPATHGSPRFVGGRGRPRDTQRREAVIAATRELLIGGGYDEVTLSEVARRAGVSRPYMYDNWGAKFALVEEVIFGAAYPAPEITDDTDFSLALRDLVTAMVHIQLDPAYQAGLPGLASELYNRSDLVAQIERRYIAPIRTAYVQLIERGKREGIVRGDVDGSALLDTIRGAVMLHTLLNTAPSGSELIEHLCTLVLHGIEVTK
jgi:AcrR family transcriptional regulator